MTCARHDKQVYTPSGWPAVSTPVLRSLAGRPGSAKAALAELTGVSQDPGGPSQHFPCPSPLHVSSK